MDNVKARFRDAEFDHPYMELLLDYRPLGNL